MINRTLLSLLFVSTCLLRAEDFTQEQRLGIMYWYAVLANFFGRGSRFYVGAEVIGDWARERPFAVRGCGDSR